MSSFLKHTSCALIAAASVASCKKGSPTPARSQNATNLEVEVLELERAWGQAYVKADKAFVDRLLAPEWRGWTDQEGSNKAAALAEFKAGSVPPLENVIDDAQVRVYGDAAVVQARERVRFRDNTGEHWLTWHITDVYVRRANQWQVVASHTSTLQNP